MHGDELQIITVNPNIDGECFMLTEDGKFIVVYTKNFSAYAVGFYRDAGGEVTDNDCFVHWIMLVLLLVYIAYALMFFLYSAKGITLANMSVGLRMLQGLLLRLAL